MQCLAASGWAAMRQNVRAGDLCRKAAAPLLAEFRAWPGATRPCLTHGVLLSFCLEEQQL